MCHVFQCSVVPACAWRVKGACGVRDVRLMQMHGVESSVQRCFMLRSAAVEWRSRCSHSPPSSTCTRSSSPFCCMWQNQWATCNAKKKKIRFLQVRRPPPPPPRPTNKQRHPNLKCTPISNAPQSQMHPNLKCNLISNAPQSQMHPNLKCALLLN